MEKAVDIQKISGRGFKLQTNSLILLLKTIEDRTDSEKIKNLEQ